MKSYYIVFEMDNKMVSDVINTLNDLDTAIGLVCEMAMLEKKYKADIIILNWKKMKKSWFSRWIEKE
jgi:hypothetical protein